MPPWVFAGWGLAAGAAAGPAHTCKEGAALPWSAPRISPWGSLGDAGEELQDGQELIYRGLMVGLDDIKGFFPSK